MVPPPDFDASWNLRVAFSTIPQDYPDGNMNCGSQTYVWRCSAEVPTTLTVSPGSWIDGSF